MVVVVKVGGGGGGGGGGFHLYKKGPTRKKGLFDI
jgi:hypothetical protein